jgi:dipeptidyl aminopeptidase/acylaminoacyl peptidase
MSSARSMEDIVARDERQGSNRERADLALIDVTNQSATRLIHDSKITWYAFSPDGASIAASLYSGLVPNTGQNEFELLRIDVRSGRVSPIASKLHLTMGTEISWRPQSGQLAFVETGDTAHGRVGLVSDSTGKIQYWDDARLPSFEGAAPRWNASGTSLFLISDDRAVWSIDVRAGKGTLLQTGNRLQVQALIAPQRSSVIWSGPDKRSIWITARDVDSGDCSFSSVDLTGGHGHIVSSDTIACPDNNELDVDTHAGRIAFIADSPSDPGNIWTLDVRTRRRTQITHINPGLQDYAMGSAHLVHWLGPRGQQLSGALLLPPDYSKGRPLPLISWVYGGGHGSEYVNSFGLRAGYPIFNMQVLATRGYAVFCPDIPMRVGTPMRDIFDDVMPGIDSLIQQGYADPERLAVMGHSYGSYTVMSLITQTQRFKAAMISAVMDPNLATFYAMMTGTGVTGSIGMLETGWARMGGSPWQFPERYRDNSPFFLLDKINTPLLMAQGTNDGGPIHGPNTVFVSLRRLGKPVEYLIYEDEDHIIQRTPDVIDLWQRRLEFFAANLHLKTDEAGRVAVE